jgi:hypothetical protein
VNESTITLFSTHAIVNGTLEIISEEGKRVLLFSLDDANIANHTTTFHLSRGNLKSGVYFYSVKENENVMAVGKLMVM